LVGQAPWWSRSVEGWAWAVGPLHKRLHALGPSLQQINPDACCAVLSALCHAGRHQSCWHVECVEW
jgi:hypothetical protein